MTTTIKATPASPGIGIGKVFWLHREQYDITQREAFPEEEAQRLDKAFIAARLDIQRTYDHLQTFSKEADIFDAHLAILDDPALLDLARSELEHGAEFAWSNAIQFYAGQLEALQDDYLRGRAVDVRDIGRQVLRHLLGIHSSDISNLKSPVILFAHDLTPSDTGQIDKSMILGFATQEGSTTSHTVILAKSLGLPAVVGAGHALQMIHDDTCIILNGDNGEIILNPDEATYQYYIELQKKEQTEHSYSLLLAQESAYTTDGHRVQIVANIGNLDDARNALANGAEGVGLLRTEFLYLNRKTAPDENDQYKIYHSIFELMGKRPVVVRTLDIGGDKYPSYLDLGQEANPFLGWRAIRVCLDSPDFFKTQLRAILRAAVDHDIRIMFPMVATLDEFRKAKSLLCEAGDEIGFTDKVEVGIMIEIPSAVQMVDLFALEVDFFSIGTNDLTQYTFAVDRTNPKVASIADASHPAILRQIQRVIQNAHAHDKGVGICGELAGDPTAIPVLIGLGVDELSMASVSIPAAKEIIRKWNFATAAKLGEDALNSESAAEVRNLVANSRQDL